MTWTTEDFIFKTSDFQFTEKNFVTDRAKCFLLVN